ncbi:hypothetical protein DMA11_08430 [Marinilabiliaceae bacterium JC017]|nr:hypothetical protein DMA11_08430 [Marinilabiliaceae bacterium JC017]
MQLTWSSIFKFSEKEKNTETPQYSKSSNDSPYGQLDKRFEQRMAEGKNMPFHIQSVKQGGIQVKVYQMQGFVPFTQMPWTYERIAFWRVVFPYLRNKLFYGEVTEITEGPVPIRIDASIRQFQHKPLQPEKTYRALILGRLDTNFIVELGQHFDWRCGSITGRLPYSKCSLELLREKSPGQMIMVVFEGNNKKQQAQVRDSNLPFKWQDKMLLTYHGKRVEVVVKKHKGITQYLVEGKYEGALEVTGQLYGANVNKVKQGIRKLVHREYIKCKVIEVNMQRGLMMLKWEMN